MTVPQVLKDRVTAELQRCIATLESKFPGHQFLMPVINYTQRGTTAGTALYSNWSINLNAGLLVDPRHTTEMIEQTAPHELAHLVTFKVYPETMEHGPLQRTRVGLKRGKREVHGSHWQHVMRSMGKSPDRCHKMDTSNVQTRERVRYKWVCTGCNKVLELGPKHNKAQEQTGKLFHKGCRGYKLVKPDGAASVQTRVPPSIPPVSAGNTGSKLDVCKALYARCTAGSSRADIIKMFITQANCTPAGAATYYYTIKKAIG